MNENLPIAWQKAKRRPRQVDAKARDGVLPDCLSQFGADIEIVVDVAWLCLSLMCWMNRGQSEFMDIFHFLRKQTQLIEIIVRPCITSFCDDAGFLVHVYFMLHGIGIAVRQLFSFLLLLGVFPSSGWLSTHMASSTGFCCSGWSGKGQIRTSMGASLLP